MSNRLFQREKQFKSSSDGSKLDVLGVINLHKDSENLITKCLNKETKNDHNAQEKKINFSFFRHYLIVKIAQY